MGVETAGKAVEMSKPTLYRLEAGQTPAKQRDVRDLCLLYGASEDLRDALVALAGLTKERGWWHSYGEVVPGWFDLYLGMESAAVLLRQYQSTLIPGLVQTAAYAAAVVPTKPGLSTEETDRRVAMRLERQRLLTRRIPRAPKLEVILAEAVLHQPIRPVAAWQEQLAHLSNLPETNPAVTIRVLPPDVGPHHALMTGTFVLLDFPPGKPGRPAEPPTVYSEGLTGALYLDRREEVTQFNWAWEWLDKNALSVRDTQLRISEIIKRTG